VRGKMRRFGITEKDVAKAIGRARTGKKQQVK
jgi:hypothetical protein